MPEQPCAFHPDRLTGVTCSHCDRPICPEDMVDAPVGIQCPICSGRMREGPLGQTAYRVRSKAERVPLVRVLAGKQLTQLIIGANILIFILMLATGKPESQSTLVHFGALIRPLPRSEWWRLFTAMFVHFGPLHLIFNMFGLFFFGPLIEGRYGKLRFLGLYLGAGLLGSAASLTFNAPCPPIFVASGQFCVAAGASGGVFGILGAWIALFARHRNAPGSAEQLRSLFFLIGINLLFGLMGQIDNFAHLGGLVGGFVIGYALELSVRARIGRARTLAGLAGYAAVVVIAAVMVLPKTY